jgi:hypothetical protein
MERDKFGKFEKGHRYLPGPVGSRIGTRRTLKSEVKDAFKLAEDAMPRVIKALIERATAGPDECPAAVRQAATEYLVDRLYGKIPDRSPADNDLIVNIISNIPRPDATAPAKPVEAKPQ